MSLIGLKLDRMGGGCFYYHDWPLNSLVPMEPVVSRKLIFFLKEINLGSKLTNTSFMQYF